MTNLLLMADCRDLDCLTAVESIIRPGAANEGKKRAFARRHQGLEPVTYAHPSLEPLLADTYGLMAYEEHILLVANGFAGMPWGRADILRRALVKNKDRRKIAEMGAEFRACALGCGPHGGGDRSRLGAARGLRRLHVQQGALGGLCRGGVPGRVSEDAVSRSSFWRPCSPTAAVSMRRSSMCSKRCAAERNFSRRT